MNTGSYIPYSADDRIKRATEHIRREWGYADATEVFPCCNVLHNGHIVYFPTLTESTPFNFTYFVASNQQRVAKTLNALHPGCPVWAEYPLELFRNSDISQDGRIIVTINLQQLNCIHEILNRRRQQACAAPMIVNVWNKNTEDARAALEKAKSAILEWRKQNGYPKPAEDIEDTEDIEEYFLYQTARKTPRQIQPANDVINLPDTLERWRVLLSDSEYYSAVVDIGGHFCQRQCISWLLTQHPLSDDTCFDRERCYLESDRALLENCDRDKFRQNRFDWEEN